MATLLMQISDVNALGQKVCEGLAYTDSFYWDMTDKTRAWSKRWSDKMGGMVPGVLHAGSYCAANHWLKAVKAAGTTDADAVVAKMKELPVNDFYNDNVKIRERWPGDARDVSVAGEASRRGDGPSTISATSWRRSRRRMPGVRLAEGGCPLIKA